jgi:flagellin
MALGVLNNLSAIYAENNLNKTDNSLQTVLQQLSSGSKINSGADDAAGLSLVNGLEANSTALTQSETNATEGVGLLDVADGALSQVTSLLDRAITLATEASNGTLNSSQEAAANEEYTSILSEINNIGSTTTYNQEQVFTGDTVAIYTGDSSSAGSSIDNLNISVLSESCVGDTDGVMSYSSGGSSSSSVFIALGSSTATASDTLTDSTGTAGTAASVTVETLSSTGATVTTTITTGGTTGYADTAEGLIEAINASGLGVTASYTTAAVAEGSSTAGGTAATAAKYGIEITGAVGTSATLSTFSDSGTLTATTTGDNLSGSITFQDGSGASTTVTMAEVTAAEGTATVANLAKYIKADTALGVSVAEDTTTTAGKDALTLTSTTTTDALTVTSNLTDSTAGTAISYTATAAHSIGITAVSVEDTTSGATSLTSATSGITSTSSGTATTSYSDEAGVSLKGTSLLTTADAETALTDLNKAVSDVAAMDGYIGAQINTLNSLSSVLTTQQENVTSAQNAIQATDYASATSAMSKYEILSQTGIAALAQANSVEQEVTKLLQS